MQNVTQALGRITRSPSDAGQGGTGSDVRGIDVSHYQGAVDWAEVKAAGKSFAFAKCAQGTRTGDAQFEQNWAGMKHAGLIRGAYDFYNVGQDPAAQARNLISRLTLEPGDLPPVVDIETESAGAESNAQLNRDLQTYLNTLEQHYEIRPIIYTSPGFWNLHFDSSFGEFPLWVAEYGVSQPKPVKGFAGWQFWQYSQQGTVHGVNGPVDLDKFNGGMAQLRAMTM